MGLQGRRKRVNFMAFRGCMNSIREQYDKKEMNKKREKRKGKNNPKRLMPIPLKPHGFYFNWH